MLGLRVAATPTEFLGGGKSVLK